MKAFVENLEKKSLGTLRERCEKALVDCENAGGQPATLRGLNLCLGDFLGALPRRDPTVGRMAQGLQHLLHALLHQRITLSVALSDALLLTLDRLESSASLDIRALSLPLMMDNLRVAELLDTLSVTDMEGQPAWLTLLTELLAPEVGDGEGDHTQHLGKLLEVCSAHGLPADPDLLFFATLTTPAEARLRRWQGRHVRLLQLGLGMNRQAGHPVDATQLAAALLVHDVSMAFMPLEWLDGQAGLTPTEQRRLHRHADISGCLLQNLVRWAEARQMIEQHHEWANGNGYPAGLGEAQIHEGAKIIAIADAFEAISHPPRFRDTHKRPYLRAAMEINNLSGIQFSSAWVKTFNQTLMALRDRGLS